MIICLGITAVLGLLYLVVIEGLQWATHPEVIWIGLLVILLGGAVVENAIRFDAMGQQPNTSASRVGRASADAPTVTPGLPA